MLIGERRVGDNPPYPLKVEAVSGKRLGAAGGRHTKGNGCEANVEGRGATVSRPYGIRVKADASPTRPYLKAGAKKAPGAAPDEGSQG